MYMTLFGVRLCVHSGLPPAAILMYMYVVTRRFDLLPSFSLSSKIVSTVTQPTSWRR